MTRRDDEEGGSIGGGLVRAWLAMKLTPIAIRVVTFLAWIGAFLAYAGFVAWRVKRLAKAGALDEAQPGGPPTPISAKDDGVFAWVRGDEVLELPGDRDGTDAAQGRTQFSPPHSETAM